MPTNISNDKRSKIMQPLVWALEHYVYHEGMHTYSNTPTLRKAKNSYSCIQLARQGR